MTPDAEPNRALLRDGDSILFIDRKQRQYLRTIRAGKKVNVRGAAFAAEDLIGMTEGTIVRSSTGEYLQVFRPTYAQLIPNLPRQAQVIYPKDIGTILMWGDIHPGAHVIEVGVGPGATSMAMLRMIGPTGTLTTYELREEFATMARGNVARFHGDAPNWTIKIRDAYEGFDETGIDRMMVDLSEPWRVVPHAARALRAGGVFVGFTPTVLQLKQLVDELRATSFAQVEVLESLQRGWHIKDRSVRPEHRMVAHSGFLVIARRLAVESAPPRATTPSIDEAPDEEALDDASPDEESDTPSDDA